MGDWTAEQIDGILHEKYGTDPWTYFSELRAATGARAQRTIDGFAVHCWPSNGRVVAFEIKVDRSDFMAELEDPTKREPFIENSTEFYYVVPHGLVQANEVPEVAGLMWAQSGSKEARVVRKKAAPQRDLGGFDVGFVRSMLREAAPAYKGRDLFHLSGEDLTHDELEEYIDGEARRVARSEGFLRTIREQERQRAEEKHEEAIEVYQWLRDNSRELGLPSLFGLDRETMEEWLENQEWAGRHAEMVVGAIARAQKQLNRAMDHLPDEE